MTIPTLVSLLIGLWGIDRVGLWGDERETLIAIPQILWRLWEAPLIPYYSVMWMWTFGGEFTSDLWLRLPSVLAMAGAVAFTAAVAARLGGTRAGFLAGVALALMPGIARYAQEVRVYAFATLLTALATWVLAKGASGTQRRWWAAYAMTLASIGVLAPFAYAIVPAHAALLAGMPEWRGAWRRWLLACLANLPVALGAAYLAMRYGGALHDWLARPGPGAYLTDFPLLTGAVVFGSVLVVLALLTRTGLVWLAGAALGMASLWLLSQGPASFWLTRSFLPLAPLLAVGAGFSAVSLGWRRLVAVTAFLGLLSVPTLVSDRQPGSRGLDPRYFAQMVDGRAQSGDAINTAINDWFAWGVARYSSRPDDFVYAPSSTGRAWVLDKDVPCTRLEEYPVPGGDSLLVLCESLPAGWENRVVRK